MPRNRMRELLSSLAQSQVKFVSASEVCKALGLDTEECLKILQEFAAEGLLRVTRSKSGESYFWLTNKFH